MDPAEEPARAAKVSLLQDQMSKLRAQIAKDDTRLVAVKQEHREPAPPPPYASAQMECFGKDDDAALNAAIEASKAECGVKDISEPVYAENRVPTIEVITVSSDDDDGSSSSSPPPSECDEARCPPLPDSDDYWPIKTPECAPYPPQDVAISSAGPVDGAHRLPPHLWTLVAQRVPIENKYRFAQTCRLFMAIVLYEDPSVTLDAGAIGAMQAVGLEKSPFCAFTLRDLDTVRSMSFLLEFGPVRFNCGIMPPYYFSLFYAAWKRINMLVCDVIFMYKNLRHLARYSASPANSDPCLPARAELERTIKANIAVNDAKVGALRFMLNVYGVAIIRVMCKVNAGCRITRVNGLDSWRWLGAEAWRLAEVAHPAIFKKCTVTYDGGDGIQRKRFRPFVDSPAGRKRRAVTDLREAVPGTPVVEYEILESPPSYADAQSSERKRVKRVVEKKKVKKHHHHHHHHHRGVEKTEDKGQREPVFRVPRVTKTLAGITPPPTQNITLSNFMHV